MAFKRTCLHAHILSLIERTNRKEEGAQKTEQHIKNCKCTHQQYVQCIKSIKRESVSEKKQQFYEIVSFSCWWRLKFFEWNVNKFQLNLSNETQNYASIILVTFNILCSQFSHHLWVLSPSNGNRIHLVQYLHPQKSFYFAGVEMLLVHTHTQTVIIYYGTTSIWNLLVRYNPTLYVN